MRLLSTENVTSSRHDTGSYYTPRPIVHYLCREGLRAWLEQFPPGKSKSTDWPARLEKLFALDDADGIDDAERAQLNELHRPADSDRITCWQQSCALLVSQRRSFQFGINNQSQSTGSVVADVASAYGNW